MQTTTENFKIQWSTKCFQQLNQGAIIFTDYGTIVKTYPLENTKGFKKEKPTSSLIRSENKKMLKATPLQVDE